VYLRSLAAYLCRFPRKFSRSLFIRACRLAEVLMDFRHPSSNNRSYLSQRFTSRLISQQKCYKRQSPVVCLHTFAHYSSCANYARYSSKSMQHDPNLVQDFSAQNPVTFNLVSINVRAKLAIPSA